MLEVCFGDSVKGALSCAQRIRELISAGELKIVKDDVSRFYNAVIARNNF